jgi:hypothetical protein
MAKQHDGSNPNPNWLPSWAPSSESVGYVAEILTAVLLVLVAIYLVSHFARGKGSPAHAATVAAGVGVGGAGT